MIDLDKVVKKLFGKDRENYDIHTTDYMKKCIRNAPDVIGKYKEYTSDDAIKDFLFEQTDVAKELKKIMDKFKYDNSEEENT